MRDELQRLPAPDPTAPDRIWQRYRATREQPVRRSWGLPVLGLALAGAAATAVAFVVWPEQPREAQLEVASVAWSETVMLETNGLGEATGLDRNLEINWERGTVKATVVPESGTKLTIVTDEARVEVVGTVFSVTRDVLGVSTEVERGRVRVTCLDGWEGLVTPENSPRLCLPVRAGLLLGRADALIDASAPPQSIRETLDRGLAVAEEDSPIRGELLVRRMRNRADAGDAPGALKDADAYLKGASESRSEEVNRFAAYLALNNSCAAGLPYLEALESDGRGADWVLLAECISASDPARARVLFEAAGSSELEEIWAERARVGLGRLGSRGR